MKKLLIILLSCSLAACGNHTTETATEEAHHEEAESNSAAITEKQMQAVGIEMDTIQFKNLTSAIKANGVLTVPNQNKALVTSVTSGIISSLLVQPGDLVHQGQVIATIINPGVAKIQQELQTTRAQIGLAELEERRQKELVEGNAAPLKNLQRAQTELTTLNATRNALQQQLTAMGISMSSDKVVTSLPVKAPISGTISEIAAQIGSNVDPSTPIAQIVNNSQLHLDLFVYEKDLPRLKPNQTIHFTVTNNAGKEFDAVIYSIGTAFASDTKTIPVHAVVKGDKSGLIEGMNVTAVISIGKAIVPAVPSEAIVMNAGQDYIFVLTSKTQPKQGEAAQETIFYFEKTPVVKGTSDIGFTEIVPVNTIPAGAKVVTKGAFFVMAKITNTGEHE
jgi:RND family efflux transporter MFP subunit